MEKAPTKKEQTHDRIVDAAARAIRRHGYAGVGVADVMKDAGLTHGGFYAHFESRDALFVAALERASRGSRALLLRRTEALRERDISAFRALVEGYLHDDLLKSNEAGCPVAALCSEMPRQSAEVRKASTVGVRALLRYVEKALPEAVPAGQAGVVAATLVGSLQLARALGSGEQGKALLATTRKALLDRYDRP